MSNPHYCHPTPPPPPPPSHCNPPPPVDCAPQPPHCPPSHHGHTGNWGPLIDIQVGGTHDGTHTAGTLAHVGVGTIDVDVGNASAGGSHADTSLVHADLGGTNIDVGGSHGLITTGPSQTTGTLLNVDLDGHGSGTGGTALPLLGSLPAVGQVLGAVDTSPAPGGSQASLVHADLGATNVDVASHDGLITTSSSSGNDAPSHAAVVNVDLDGSASTGGSAGIPVVGSLLDLGNILAGGATGGTDLPVVGSILNIGHILGGDASGGGTDLPLLGNLLGGDTGDAFLGQILTAAPTSILGDLLGGGSNGGDTCGCDGGHIALPLLGELGHLDHVLHL